MANKVYNLAGGLHSAAAYAGWENELFGGNAVASQTALQVSAGSGMTVSVGKGNALIDTGDDYSRRVALTEAINVTLDQADTSLPRNDLIVIYVDMAVAPVQTVQDNTNGILKVVAVKGTPASSPSDPDAGTIQQTIGAGNPYMTLASIRVNAGASAISSGNITDKRPTSPNVYLTTSVFNNAFNVLGLDVSFCIRNGVCFVLADGNINGATGTRYVSTNTLPQNIFDAIASAGLFRKFIVWGSNGTVGQAHFAGDRKLYMYFPESIPSGTTVTFIGSWPVTN